MPLSERDQSIVKMVAKAARRRYDELKDAFSTEIKALSGQIVELRSAVDHRPERGEKGDPGNDGKSVTAEDVLPALKAHVDALVRDFPVPEKGEDGKSVTPDDVFPLIEAKFEGWARDFERHATGVVQRAIERIPAPREGRNGKDSDPDLVAAKVIERLDLKGTRTDMKRLCAELVDKRVAEIHVPQDGKDATDDQVAAAVAKYIEAHPPEPGRDGESVSMEQIEALVEKRLAARVSEWALDFEKRAHETLQKAVDRLPKPKDGVDGFSLEDLDIKTTDGGRTWVLSFRNGDRVVERSIVTEMPHYRDVWKAADDYAVGDMVTYGGSTWICLKANTGDKPGSFSKSWKLIVKKGRDGSSS